MVGSKILGALIGWLPGLFVDALVSFWTTQGWHNFNSVCTEYLGQFVTTIFILIPHLAAVLSVYLRWGAVPLSIAISIGSYIFCMILISSSGAFSQNSPIFILLSFTVLATCAACHVVVVFRLRQIAST